jgi:ubiquinone/menaquinone biosynthesis C-methylase UbiE
MKEHSDQKTYEKTVKHLYLKNKNVLEIRCGDGRISSYLSKESESFIAVDPDEKKIRPAKTHIPGVDFRIGSGKELNFPDSFFDLVIFPLSLHHQNSQKAISEATRVLRNGGQLLVVEAATELTASTTTGRHDRHTRNPLRVEKRNHRLAKDPSGIS